MMMSNCCPRQAWIASNGSWSTPPIFSFFYKSRVKYEYIANLHLKKEDVTLILPDVGYPLDRGGAKNNP